MKSLDSGFTLVELLVVLIILGIISGISVIAFGNSHRNSVRSACKTDYQATLLGIQGYQADHGGQLPASLLELAPTYITSGLLDSSSFIFSLQSLPNVSDNVNIAVATASGTVSRKAELVSSDATSITFKLIDTTNLVNEMRVQGSGLTTLFAAQASAEAGVPTLNLDETSGIKTGMSVTGDGIQSGAVVSSVVSSTQITISLNTSAQLSSSGVIFGELPTVTNVAQSTGLVTVSNPSNAQFISVSTPEVGGKYTLTFTDGKGPTGTLIPGVAPTACEKL